MVKIVKGTTPGILARKSKEWTDFLLDEYKKMGMTFLK